MKKILSIILACLLAVLFGLVGCDSNNGGGGETDVWVGDHLECIVDVDCDEIIEKGYPSNYWYRSEGVINIDIKKFSNEYLRFDYVSVIVEIYLSDFYGGWRFAGNGDVEEIDTLTQKMTKVIEVSKGGNANFSIEIFLDYDSSALVSIKEGLKKPNVSAYIIGKESGSITKK